MCTWFSLSQRQPLKKKAPVPINVAVATAAISPPTKSSKPLKSPPSHSTTPSTLSPTSPTDEFDLDRPEPVYEVIPDQEEIYVAIADFQAGSAGDGLSFQTGALFSVITKNATGWWYVDMAGSEGWVPSSYLERKHSKSPSPTSLKSQSPAASFGRSWTPQKSKQQDQRRKQDDVLSKSTSSLTHRKRSISPPTQPKRPSLKRTSSTGSIEYDKPHKPKFHRPPSPPATITSARHPVASHTNKHPKRPSAPATVSRSEKFSPPTTRIIKHSFDSGKTLPVTRKVTVSKTVSSGDASPRTIRNQTSLELPSTHHVRSTTIGAKSPRRENGMPSTSKQELEKALQQRTTLHTTSVAGARRTSPQKPKPPPSPSAEIKKRILPKRPEPPKPGAKKQPPPRPSTSPVLKKSYVAISDYSGDDASCLSFKEGDTVEVVKKSSNGWWYIKIGFREGWAPSTYLDEKTSDSKPKPVRPTKPPAPKVNQVQARPVPKPRTRTKVSSPSSNNYRAVADYDVPIYEDSGIPLLEGKLYEVLEKNDSGWWFVSDGDREGWAPASYFDPA